METIKLALKDFAVSSLRCGPIPQHVGFIMDGNRRWGKKAKVGTDQGYYAGFDVLEEMLAVSMELGIKALTVYAFSIENFKRPPEQVNTLMNLALDKLVELCQHSELVKDYGICVRVLGNMSLLPEHVQKVFQETVQLTKDNNRAIFNLCFSYTSRDELAMATQSLVSGMEAQDLYSSDITTEALQDTFYTRSCPPMDLLIRTSGEIRLSDFMLWQASKTCHVEFLECYWPEFTFWKMLPVLLRYQRRARSLKNERAQLEQEAAATRIQQYKDRIVSLSLQDPDTEHVGQDAGAQDGDSVLPLQIQETPLEISPHSKGQQPLLSASTLTVKATMMADPEDKKSVPFKSVHERWEAERKQRLGNFWQQRGYLITTPMVQLQ